MKDYRVPISAVVIDVGGNEFVVVVCNDGSVWRNTNGSWTEEAPVPGSHRARTMKQ